MSDLDPLSVTAEATASLAPPWAVAAISTIAGNSTNPEQGSAVGPGQDLELGPTDIRSSRLPMRTPKITNPVAVSFGWTAFSANASYAGGFILALDSCADFPGFPSVSASVCPRREQIAPYFARSIMPTQKSAGDW